MGVLKITHELRPFSISTHEHLFEFLVELIFVQLVYVRYDVLVVVHIRFRLRPRILRSGHLGHRAALPGASEPRVQLRGKKSCKHLRNRNANYLRQCIYYNSFYVKVITIFSMRGFFLLRYTTIIFPESVDIFLSTLQGQAFDVQNYRNYCTYYVRDISVYCLLLCAGKIVTNMFFFIVQLYYTIGFHQIYRNFLSFTDNLTSTLTAIDFLHL